MKRLLCLLALAAVLLPVSAGDLQVVSYNIRQDTRSDTGPRDWPNRKALVAAYLRDSGAQIIGLQEVHHNQLRDLDTALPHHASLGVGREDGKRRGEHSPIFYDRRHWKPDPEEQGTFWLSESPEIPNSRSWGNKVTRICTWARLIATSGPRKGSALYVYNTHWDHQSQASRVESGLLILKRLKTRRHLDEPVVLMGDFNATTGNPAVKNLLDSGHVVDHGTRQHATGSRWVARLVPGERIDHVFTSPSIRKATLVVERNGEEGGHAGSDHHPVRLTIPAESLFKP